jgi:hypothetical protein
MFWTMLMTLLKNSLAFISEPTVSAFLITICKCEEHNFMRDKVTHRLGWFTFLVLSRTTPRGAIRRLHSKQPEVYRLAPHVVDLSPSKINKRAESFLQHATGKQRWTCRSVIVISWHQRKIGVRCGIFFLSFIRPHNCNTMDCTLM